MENDLQLLEQKLAILIAHTRALRAANESLRHDLASATRRNQEMNVKVQQAGARLDALIARIPHE
jgi:division protein CdvB (Snf7/Vps24/ESCRT-III family)